MNCTMWRLSWWSFVINPVDTVDLKSADFYDYDEAIEAYDEMIVSEDTPDIRLDEVICDRKYGVAIELNMIRRKVFGRGECEVF